MSPFETILFIGVLLGALLSIAIGFWLGRVGPITSSAPPATTSTPVPPPPAQLGPIPDREKAWEVFKEFCVEWNRNFGVEGTPQPDRVKLMGDLGVGRHVRSVLLMAYEIGSLQRLVQKALAESGTELDLDQIEQVTTNMVAVSHAGFPDLAGTYDYSTRWQRVAP